MENWGIVIYREYFLLYDQANDPFTKQKEIFDVITHEVSHQWVILIGKIFSIQQN